MPDVTILVYAHRGELPQHPPHREWLQRLLNGMESYAVSDAVLNGFLRLVTNRRVFKTPTPLDDALRFADTFRHRPQAIVVAPGPRHWPIFDQLCRGTGATGRDVPDAHLAALAIEHGCEFVTAQGLQPLRRPAHQGHRRLSRGVFRRAWAAAARRAPAPAAGSAG